MLKSLEAKAYIRLLHKNDPGGSAKLRRPELISHMKVDYKSVKCMPEYKQKKIEMIIKYVVDRFDPQEIRLVMSQLNGCPIDEKTSQEDFDLKKEAYGSAKMSDWDLIVDSISGHQVIECISPFIKVDMFKYHHAGVKKLLLYKKS